MLHLALSTPGSALPYGIYLYVHHLLVLWDALKRANLPHFLVQKPQVDSYLPHLLVRSAPNCSPVVLERSGGVKCLRGRHPCNIASKACECVFAGVTFFAT